MSLTGWALAVYGGHYSNENERFIFMPAWIEQLLKDPVGGAILAANKLYKVDFVINPDAWGSANIAPPFLWESVEFQEEKVEEIPTDPGLYAFVLRLPYDGLPGHGWVLYIGETGHGDSKHNLRARFKNYHAERRKLKRQNVYFMLNAWKDHLHFFYTRLPDRKHELKTLETKLLDAFKPPYVTSGYSGALMSPQKAY